MTTAALHEMPNQAPAPSLLDTIKRGANYWVGIDFRSLALYRITLALVILTDLRNRLVDLRAHYTDWGVLPRDEYLDQFMGKWIWSFHLAFGHEYGMALLFGLNILFACWLLFGYRTRLATLLCWAWAVSLQGRMPMNLQAGDVLLRLMLFWAMFLPLGAKYSIDAAMQKIPKQLPSRLLSFGGLAILLQTLYVYEFSLFFKTGKEWVSTYTSVYFAASLDHFKTPLADLMHQSPGTMKFFTVFTFYLEMLGPAIAFLFVIFMLPKLIPAFRNAFPRYTAEPVRMLMVVMMMGMHVGFGAVLKVGMFVYISCTSWVPYIPTWWWDKTHAALMRGRRAELRIHYDPSDAGRYKLLLIVLEFYVIPRGCLVELTDETRQRITRGRSWLVEADGRFYEGLDAFMRLGPASPVVFWWHWLLVPAYLLVHWPLALVHRIRTKYSAQTRSLLFSGFAIAVQAKLMATYFVWGHPYHLDKYYSLNPGLEWSVAVGGLLLVVAAYFAARSPEAAVENRERPSLRWLYFRDIGWRPTVIMSFLALAAISYVTVWNVDTAIGKDNHGRPYPKIMDGDWKRIAWTFRLDQKWNMFAPFPMKGDGWFVMAGTTRDGTIVDVWREQEGVSFEKPDEVSVYYPGQRWRKYLMNIWLKKYKKHRLHFGRFMCREYNEDRAGTDPKRIENFHIYYIKELTKDPARDGVLKVDGHTFNFGEDIAGENTADLKCITLWRHWCSTRGKNSKVKAVYEADCDAINGKKPGDKADPKAEKEKPKSARGASVRSGKARDKPPLGPRKARGQK